MAISTGSDSERLDCRVDLEVQVSWASSALNARKSDKVLIGNAGAFYFAMFEPEIIGNPRADVKQQMFQSKFKGCSVHTKQLVRKKIRHIHFAFNMTITMKK
jgi:hypothetical protein